MGKRRKLSQSTQAQQCNKGISGKQQQQQQHGSGKGGRGTKKPQPHKQSGDSKNNVNASTSVSISRQQRETVVDPIIPFSPGDKILLVGEGDLSFAASLIEHHYCADVTATVLEKNLEELLEKYPHVGENIAKVETEYGRVLYNVDATKMAPFAEKKGKESLGVMDRIFFNFPHVGGKSTDVNRQVRYNQELLVSFFKRAMVSLAPGGSIIVTLFEGEPYTLWNIRDLGRHSGLQVERSFKFQASAYPGYHHARTLGVVKNKSGEVGGGWKGEERPARSYVFVRKDEAPSSISRSSKKRSRGNDSDSSDED